MFIFIYLLYVTGLRCGNLSRYSRQRAIPGTQIVSCWGTVSGAVG